MPQINEELRRVIQDCGYSPEQTSGNLRLLYLHVREQAEAMGGQMNGGEVPPEFITLVRMLGNQLEV